MSISRCNYLDLIKCFLNKKRSNIESPLIGAYPYNAEVGGYQALVTIERRQQVGSNGKLGDQGSRGSVYSYILNMGEGGQLVIL